MIYVTTDINIPGIDAIIDNLGLGDHGRAQMMLDQAVIDYCTNGNYVPASPDRTLEFSANVSTDVGSGYVIWNTPYARYQYYGLVMTDEAGRTWVGPGEQKPIITDRPLVYDTAQNPNAGAFWVERMKADHMDDLTNAVRYAIEGRWNRG